MLKYTETHEWVHPGDDKIATIGISEHARDELGEIVYLQLPGLGEEISCGDEAVVLESTKAAADIYAPISGTVVEVNRGLVENTDLLNRSPEGEGWLFKVEMSHPEELSSLLDKDAYRELISH